MPSRHAAPGLRSRARIGSQAAPVVLMASCAKCQRAATLAFMDLDRTSPDLPEGAPWECPHCRTRNRLPAVGTVTSIVRV